MGIAWAYRGHGMGIAGTWFCNPKAKRDTVPGIQKPGVQRGVATLPLQNYRNLFRCILLQPRQTENILSENP